MPTWISGPITITLHQTAWTRQGPSSRSLALFPRVITEAFLVSAEQTVLLLSSSANDPHAVYQERLRGDRPCVLLWFRRHSLSGHRKRAWPWTSLSSTGARLGGGSRRRIYPAHVYRPRPQWSQVQERLARKSRHPVCCCFINNSVLPAVSASHPRPFRRLHHDSQDLTHPPSLRSHCFTPPHFDHARSSHQCIAFFLT